MPHYKLIYFNIRGLAELPRLILHYAGVEFEDHRIERSEWAALKPHMPFGQVPVLEVDGKVLAQSQAIARYLAREHGLAGKDNWEQAQVDMYADCFRDVVAAGRGFTAEQDADKKAELLEKLIAETVMPLVAKIEARLKHNGGVLVGNDITWADIMLCVLMTSRHQPADALDNAPHVRALIDRIEHNPRIKTYRDAHPTISGDH